MRFLLTCLLATLGYAADPVVSAWILARPTDNAALRKVQPDVHEVIVEDQFVEVRSAGLSLLYLGPFQNPLTGDGGLRDLRFRLPRKPVIQEDTSQQRIGPGELGVFLNGVPLYNRFAEASYLGRNMWHFDTVALKDPTHLTALGVLESMIANGSAHSPILGFALDGFPIYGSWGFDDSGKLRRMHSGYHLRTIQERTRWPDGTMLTPSQYGPPVDAQFPLGTFVEDYEYRPAAGDLDASNGRFAVTPEYPRGTYAYFLTTDEQSRLAFPYFLTERYRGKLPGVPETARVPFAHGALEVGKPVELRFTFGDARALEIVHERPAHLMVISADLAEFDHIHPEWKLGDFYSVTHTFRRPGKYRLFTQYTLPGEPERLETFDVEVTGAAAAPDPRTPLPITARLRHPDIVRAGQDIPFTVELSGEPVEPYLGAWGHFVFLDDQSRNFIHAHPAGNASEPPDPTRPHIHGVSDVASGPPPSTVTFTTNFAQAGHYKLWAQFQVAGNPIAIPFTVEVAEAGSATHAAVRIPAGAIAMTVDARGFTPVRIDAVTGKPVTLAITRANTPNCGSRIVFPSLGIQRDLPLGETTVVELPKLTSDIAFACGMGMYRGMIVGVVQK